LTEVLKPTASVQYDASVPNGTQLDQNRARFTGVEATQTKHVDDVRSLTVHKLKDSFDSLTPYARILIFHYSEDDDVERAIDSDVCAEQRIGAVASLSCTK
jgi:hypothetical protein